MVQEQIMIGVAKDIFQEHLSLDSCIEYWTDNRQDCNDLIGI